MTVTISEGLQIVAYTPAHRNAFSKLNYDWISRYFKVEEPDRCALENPEEYILNKGGYIFMALYNEEAVGACALIKIDEYSMELAKMAVDDNAKGKGIGYALGKACIDKARKLGLHKVELLSNTLLTPAINLYKKLGFIEVPLPPTEYERANIKMELIL